MKPYLLLVEDDEATTYLILNALERSVFPGNVLRVKDGEEALQHLFSRKSRPALILLDMGLPKISGLEVLGMIRNTADLMSIPVILQTSASHVLQGDQERAYALGVSKIIVKPMDFHDLVTQMTEMAEMFRAAVCDGYEDCYD